MKWPAISDDEAVQAEYVRIRKRLAAEHKEKGTEPHETSDHRFAELLALRRFPGTQTTDTFNKGRGTLLQQFGGDREALGVLMKNCQQQGFTPSDHSVYYGSLADRPGDPKALCPPGEGRDWVKKRALERGTGCYGRVNVPAPQREPRDVVKNPEIRLAPDIVDGEIRQRLKKNPDLKGKIRKKGGLRELREQVIHEHSRVG